MKSREEIEEKYKWDLTKFCRDDADFYAKLEKLEKKIPEIKKFEGKLSDDSTLLKYLNFKTKMEDESFFLPYAHYRQSEDMSARSANDMVQKRDLVLAKLGTALSEVDIEISKFSLAKLQKLGKGPKFKAYKRYFELEIRHKKHTLSKKEEVLLSKIDEFLGGFSDTFDKLNDVDMKFGKILDNKGKAHELTNSNFSILAASTDRTLRENAFRQLNGKRGEFINTISTNYINDVKADCILAKIKHYKSALAWSIYGEEASEDVYKMLIKKVRENVGILQRFFEIKRKMLGLDKFAIYDTFAPVSAHNSRKFTYDEAIEIIKKAVAPLGEDYVALIQRARDERWIDVFPNKNKESGAYESGAKGATPVVMTNFESDLDGVFTLAHELGHAMHSYFTFENQPTQTASYVIFVAEVASITNEMLLLNYFLENAKDDKEKIAYYDKFLTDMRSTIFRQTMFAEFEEFAHEEYEKEHPLSAELLCDKYEELNNFYHGKKVKQVPEMRFEWARIPHFYSSFYVYKYAIGMICAIKISNKLAKDETFAKSYKKFLSSGCVTDPISLLKIADCDLTKEQTFDEAFKVCEDFVSKWENVL